VRDELVAPRHFRHIDVGVAGRASRQKGLITTRELRALGLDGSAVRRRVRRGLLHKVHRGVYAVGHAALTRDASYLAAVLACGPGALLSHLSAADLWGIRPDRRSVVDVWVPKQRRAHNGVRVHRTALAGDGAARHGIPVTSLHQTLTDVAKLLSGDELGRVVHEARVRHGVEFELGEPLLLSEAEARLMVLVKDAGLPVPRTNVMVRGAREWHRADAWWPDHRLVVEIDGYRYHASRQAFEHDRESTADLQDAGIEVLRFSVRQLARRDRVVQRLERRLRR
jgi:very-short-patch-repair endonuclease